ncbi:hypothetical protein DDT56_09095 [Brenneria corticis]|uniref:Uncharacterized protein n=1 Tax=Brenneria corticis TaxID=2173106 RepID=A0A2U1U5D6_9GAMM|nr:hypothetical protein DDT56_09095 [Brenneria sp. CFCC 11842]
MQGLITGFALTRRKKLCRGELDRRVSSRDAAKTSAAPDKNARSVFEQHLCWPVRASPMDGASIPRHWRLE